MWTDLKGSFTWDENYNDNHCENETKIVKQNRCGPRISQKRAQPRANLLLDYLCPKNEEDRTMKGSKCLLRNYGKPHMLIPAFTSIVQSQSLSHHMNRALVNIPYPTQWSLCTRACVLSRSRNVFWLAAQSVKDVLVVVVDEAFRRTDQQRTRLHSLLKIFCDCDFFSIRLFTLGIYYYSFLWNE